ncbi:hypothetical protein [Verminephrobacter eiseniae]|uniref:hypothetical protein n=1 Tax=Verminephrobacter eiseniae TaxID=364317 RepID=UPI0022384742|nr:hypothetical protein [Verminephrobacter eiseniae]
MSAEATGVRPRWRQPGLRETAASSVAAGRPNPAVPTASAALCRMMNDPDHAKPRTNAGETFAGKKPATPLWKAEIFHDAIK